MRSREELIRDVSPFPDKVIKQLPPRGDNYVPWDQYAQRLLLHYGGYNWVPGDPVEGETHQRQKDGTVTVEHVWTVRGDLTLAGETYGAVGEDTTPTSAESNAFKRACSHAGIGLHLYESDRTVFWLHDRLKKKVDDERPFEDNE